MNQTNIVDEDADHEDNFGDCHDDDGDGDDNDNDDKYKVNDDHNNDNNDDNDNDNDDDDDNNVFTSVLNLSFSATCSPLRVFSSST